MAVARDKRYHPSEEEKRKEKGRERRMGKGGNDLACCSDEVLCSVPHSSPCLLYKSRHDVCARSEGSRSSGSFTEMVIIDFTKREHR